MKGWVYTLNSEILCEKKFPLRVDMSTPLIFFYLVFSYLECADFISESHLTILLPALLKCGPFDHWLPHISPVSRVELFAYSLLELFVCIEHLLTNYSAPCQTLSSTELLSQIVQTILSCLQLAGGVDEKALNTLAVMLKHRDTPLKVRGMCFTITYYIVLVRNTCK